MIEPLGAIRTLMWIEARRRVVEAIGAKGWKLNQFDAKALNALTERYLSEFGDDLLIEIRVRYAKQIGRWIDEWEQARVPEIVG